MTSSLVKTQYGFTFLSPKLCSTGNASSFPVNDRHRQAPVAQRNLNNSEANTSPTHRAREHVEIQRTAIPVQACGQDLSVDSITHFYILP